MSQPQQEGPQRGFLGSMLPFITSALPGLGGAAWLSSLPFHRDAADPLYATLKKQVNVPVEHSPYTEPGYHILHRKVQVPPIGDLSLGTLAHEMGHAEQFAKNTLESKFPVTTGALSFVPGAASLGMLFTGDRKKTDQHLLAGSALASTPNLLREIGASIRGMNLLSKVPGATLRHRLMVFAGLPTYLAQAATPYMTMKGKEWGGWYSKPKQASIPAKVRAAMQAGDFAALAAMGRAGAAKRIANGQKRLSKLYARRPDLLATRGQPRPWIEPQSPSLTSRLQGLWPQHAETPSAQHVLDWHEQDMASLLKDAAQGLLNLR